jgi:hypothetical protein
MVLLVAVAGVVWLLILIDRPRLMLGFFLAVLIALPAWEEISVGGLLHLAPATIAAIAVMPAALRGSNVQVVRVDVLMALFTVGATVAVLVAGSSYSALAAVYSEWIPAYLVGRFLTQATGVEFASRAVAVAGAVVSAWAIIEFVTGLHVYENFAGTAPFSWQDIQVRGSHARSEAGFGHSIALGGFITIAAPFVVTASYRNWTRLAMLVLLAGGAFVTFSRGALIGLGLAAVLSAWALRSDQMTRIFRTNLRLLTFGAITVLVPLALRLFSTAGEELGQSSTYRTDLTRFILQDINWLGPADQMQTDASGQTFYRSFLSIDNEYILLTLQFGWLPLLVLLAALSFLVVRLSKRRCSPADVAVVASAFVLATVAFITQYTMAFWFVAGLAVAHAQGESLKGDVESVAPGQRRVRAARRKRGLAPRLGAN